MGWLVTLAPSGRSASFTAFMIAAGAPPVPASPAPFAPSMEVFVGVCTCAHSMSGISAASARVVGHVGVQELAAIVVQAMLVERAADALHDAAARLLVHQLRVDDAPQSSTHQSSGA